MDWVSYCTIVIEHYHASAKKISRWRARAHRERLALHHVDWHNPALAARHRDEMLAESWQLARDAAIGTMARLDARGSMVNDYFPAGVKRKLQEIFGAELPHPYGD